MIWRWHINIQEANKFSTNLSIALITALLLSACNDQSSQITNDISMDDSAIMEAIYFDHRIPDDFYRENFPNDTYHSISHVKNVDLMLPAASSGLPRYELSANNFSEALDWSETSATLQPTYRELTDNTHTELYFQFTRVDQSNPEFVHINRVLKKTALDRSNVDLDSSDDYQGRILIQPLTKDSVKNVVEYFWTFSYSNNYGNTVLDSSTVEIEDEFIHILQEARLQMNPLGNCDTIELFETHYTVEKNSGDVHKNTVHIRNISSRRDGWEPTTCIS